MRYLFKIQALGPYSDLWNLTHWDYGSAACIFNAFPGEFIHTEIQELLVFGQWATLKWVSAAKHEVSSRLPTGGIRACLEGMALKHGEWEGSTEEVRRVHWTRWTDKACWGQMRRREREDGLGGFLRGGTSMSKAWRCEIQSMGMTGVWVGLLETCSGKHTKKVRSWGLEGRTEEVIPALKTMLRKWECGHLCGPVACWACCSPCVPRISLGAVEWGRCGEGRERLWAT